MTKPSVISRVLIGNIVDFSNRYCIICFSETEINLIMLSRLSSKKVTEIIRITRNEFTMKFQVFKKFGKFTRATASIDLFKRIYQ